MMRWLRRKRREAEPGALLCVTEDGHRVMIMREIAYVQARGSDAAYAIHIPTAAVALARPVVGKA